MKWRFLLCLVLAASQFSQAQAQSINYPDKKALVLNTSPDIELGNFGFANHHWDGRIRFEHRLTWKNVGQQPIIAFQIVVLNYDAFDQREIATRWTVSGTNSANWVPLKPGDSSGDATIGYGSEQVFTAIAYVRAARFADGTVWRVNDADLQQKLRDVAPSIKDFGSVKPDPITRESK